MRLPSRACRSALVALVFGLVWLSAYSLLAQPATELAQPAPTPEASPAPMPSKPATSVVQVKPEIVYLKNKAGELVPVTLDITSEEYEEWIKAKQGLNSKQPLPDYSLGEMTIAGEVQGTTAELQVTQKLTVNAQDNRWIRIPFRFANMVLRETPAHEQAGEFFFAYEGETEGYVCWLRAAANSDHTFVCKFAGKVQELGAESRLAITAPRATVGSLQLLVPIERVEARCVRRSGEELKLEVRSADGKSTLAVDLLGPAGDVQLVWRAGAAAAPQFRQVLEATTGVLVKLEGKRRLTSEARIKVRSLGAPMESFRVRLPPGMNLVTIEQPKAQLSVLEPELDPNSQLLSQVVEVRLGAKTNGPIEIPILAELVRDSSSTDLPLEVGGFEVLDAIKQWGTVDLAVEGDLSAIWVEGANIRRVDDTATDPLRANRSLAKFEFDAQPFALQVQVVPKRTRVSVEPTYVLYVDSRQVRIDATLKYKIRGAKTYQLEYDFRDWTIDRVGPDNLVQGDALLAEKVTPLAIPLASAALPASGEFELRIQAHRDLPADARDCQFSIPRPIGAVLTPGNVVVVPADNVELTPRVADLQGLTADPIPSTIKLPTRQQSPLYYRELGGGVAAQFGAGFQVRPRTVTVAATGEVRLESQRAQIEERLAYNIAYEPLRNVELDVPRTLWEAGQMQVLLDGSALPVVLQPAQAEDDPARATIRVDLLSDRIGKVELAVRYHTPLPKLEGDEPQVWPLPLVLPCLDGERKNTAMTLRVTHDGVYEVGVGGDGWSSSQRFSPAARLEHVGEWSHATGADEFELQIAPQQAGNQGSVVVDQLWLQTWLTNAGRQDRAVFRVTTSSSQLRVQLPPQTRDADLEVALDGRRATNYVIDAEGVLTLEMPRVRESDSHVIELWYEFNAGRPALGSMKLAAPKLKGSGDARRAYWQLVLPDNEHLLLDPPNISADMVWRWRGTHWGRVGSLSQHELETWCNASVQADLPAGTNAYLFSTFGPLETLQVRTELRRNVLLGCSGLALVIGLALMYMPLARHPAMLLAAGIALAMLGLWSPDLALLVSQAAVLGLLCVLLARLLMAIFGRRRAIPAVLSSPTPSSVDHRSTEAHTRPESGSQATTAAVPMVTAGATGESEP